MKRHRESVPRRGSRGEVARAGLTLLETCVHALLRARGVYPETVFERRQACGIAVWMSRSASLNEYVRSLVEPIESMLVAGVLQSFVFDVVVHEPKKEKNKSDDPNGKRRANSGETEGGTSNVPLQNADRTATETLNSIAVAERYLFEFGWTPQSARAANAGAAGNGNGKSRAVEIDLNKNNAIAAAKTVEVVPVIEEGGSSSRNVAVLPSMEAVFCSFLAKIHLIDNLVGILQEGLPLGFRAMVKLKSIGNPNSKWASNASPNANPIRNAGDVDGFQSLSAAAIESFFGNWEVLTPDPPPGVFNPRKKRAHELNPSFPSSPNLLPASPKERGHARPAAIAIDVSQTPVRTSARTRSRDAAAAGAQKAVLALSVASPVLSQDSAPTSVLVSESPTPESSPTMEKSRSTATSKSKSNSNAIAPPAVTLATEPSYVSENNAYLDALFPIKTGAFGSGDSQLWINLICRRSPTTRFHVFPAHPIR